MTIGLSKMNEELTILSSRKKGIQTYKENPFWDSTEVKIGTKKISVAGGMHVSDEGESVTHSGVHVVREVDENEFMKVYTKNIKSIFDLKPSTQRVLQYLLTELQKTPNADAIYLAWIGAEEYFSEQDLNVSRSSFQRSMKELLNKGLLAESTKPSMFWFNPNLFFNGNRMSFVHEYRKKIVTEIK
jgi:predicted transcriptional regulator